MSDIHQILQAYWGYSSFRPLQEDIIYSVLEGKDTLALLPTGGGKSICFQVPALAIEGKLCLVVSPLIALMKDQVEQLQRRNIPAEAIFSGMSSSQIEQALQKAEQGKIKFLYLSPERLKTELLKARTPKLNIGLLAIDEAHCISQWGYDFRPPYLEIAAYRELLPIQTPIIALTATATPLAKEDIQKRLNFKENKQVFQKSFARSNLSYSAFEEENKLGRLLKILKNVQGTAVVYVRNRKKTKETAEFLQRNNISADFYHAGLAHEQRNYKQNQWIKSNIRVIVATNAFGMGIDKPDVRVVVHLDLPDSLEAYYQEAGRAGRDEQKAYAVALFEKVDIDELQKKVEEGYPPLETLRNTYQALANFLQIAVNANELQDFDFDWLNFANTYKLPRLATYQALKRLSELGLIQFSESFYRPSQVRVLQNARDFYEFQLKNPTFQYIAQWLLRQKGAVIYEYFVQISEKQIAQALKTSPSKVVEMLKNMHQIKVIDYQPQNENPKITFLTPRYDANKMPIDTQLLEERKKRDLEKVNAVITYIKHKNRCRTAILLDYFGEVYDNCGVCDNCLQKKKQSGNTKNYQENILKILKEKPLRLIELQTLLKPDDEKSFLQILRELLDKGVITKNDKGEFYCNQ